MIVSISALIFRQPKVFVLTKLFQYSVEYTTGGKTNLDTITISATGRPWPADPVNQLEIVIEYDVENLDTAFFSGIQSIGWVRPDATGANDNTNYCWFHPPKHNQYKLLELAPFPGVEYPLFLNKAYSRVLFIGAGLGDRSNTKSSGTTLSKAI